MLVDGPRDFYRAAVPNRDYEILDRAVKIVFRFRTGL